MRFLQRVLIAPSRCLILGFCLVMVSVYVFSYWGTSVRQRLQEGELERLLLRHIQNLNFSQATVVGKLAPLTSNPAVHNVDKARERKLLPATVVPPSDWVKYTDKWHGLTLPVITCEPLGRLGNVMGEYATLYALRRHYNATVLVHNNMKKVLNILFPDISLPDLPGPFVAREWKRLANTGGLYDYGHMELAAAGQMGPHRFVAMEYPFEIQLFNPFKKELQNEFKFASRYRKDASSFLSNITEMRRKNGLSDPVFIGFHIRRTDYAKHFRNVFAADLPDTPYYNRALDHYRTKFPGTATFIVASDDSSFAKSRLEEHEDVVFSTGTSAGHDMALLASCNHTITTLGSFGFWCGYLAGGDVVYPDIQTKEEYRFTRPMYEKTGLQSFIPLPGH